MAMSCSVCGSALPPGARFCPNCGAAVGPLLATDERKLVTVLFADLVNSTALARRLDPERERELLSAFFDVATEELQALRGRPEKYIGDAVMAVFGLPRVREDDAVRAIRAALAIRARARRLASEAGLGDAFEVRIGVESGEAATGVGPGGQLLVTGTVVNKAVRLQVAARPGQILAGPTARALAANRIVFGTRRRVRAKGFEAGLTAYAVDGLTTRSARSTIPFVDRASEQAILGDSLGLASSSGRPVLVTLIGEAGIGKSRLAEELAAGLSASVRVLRGRAVEHSATATFSPLTAIVGELASIDEDDTDSVVRRKLEALTADCCADSEPARVAERLALLFGAAARREESAFVPDVHAAFTALLDGLARDHPVLLIFEDAHSLRPAMLDLIERLGTAPADRPRRVLLLVLARPELLEARPAWAVEGAGSVLLRLAPLSVDHSTHLARHAAAGRLDERATTAVVRRTGGNPFFIVETTGMLVDSGEAAASRRPALPPTVQATVGARLDALPARLRQVARHAAVFMYGFDLDELRTIDPGVTAAELDALEEAEVVVTDDALKDGRWRLRHPVLKEVAYASLPKRERVRLHRLVAQDLLEAGRRSWAADHLELAALAALDLDPSDRSVPDEAAQALLAAADQARRRLESRSALDRYERALALCGSEDGWGAREARALAGMGEALYWLGDYAAAVDVLERAIALGEQAGDAWTLALALRFRGDVAINFEGDLDKAERLLQRSLEEAERVGDSWAIVRTLLFAGWVPWTRERYDEAEATWRRALDLTDPKDGWARVRALTALSINHDEMRDRDGALELVEQAERVAAEFDDDFSRGIALVQKGRLYDDRERREEAIGCFDRALAIFAELGARWEEADAIAARGIAKRGLGRLDEAEADLRSAIGTAEELGDRQLPAWTWRALARVSELRGDVAEAEELRRRSREAETLGPH